jgi:hypothetical protein
MTSDRAPALKVWEWVLSWLNLPPTIAFSPDRQGRSQWLQKRRVLQHPHRDSAYFNVQNPGSYYCLTKLFTMFDPSVVEISDDSSDDASNGLAEDNHELLQVLDSIQSTGKTATFSRYSAFVNPGLTIEGNHLIPLPLKEGDAQAIKSVCRQAPFGHGDETVVDTSVRNTWELDASKFELANSEWPGFFDGIL